MTTTPKRDHQSTARTEPLGPWGTSRADERRYGYPPPRLVPSAAIATRIDELEARILALLETRP